MADMEQRQEIAVLDIEARLRSASEVLGGVSNLIELGQDVGDIDPETAERLGAMACMVTSQAEFVRDQLVYTEATEPISPLSAVPQPPEETELGALRHEPAQGQIEADTEIDTVGAEAGGEEVLYGPGLLDLSANPEDLVEGLTGAEVGVLERLLQNPGTKFYPRDLSYMLGGGSKAATAQRFRTFIRRVEESPIGAHLKAGGIAKGRQYWIDPAPRELVDETPGDQSPKSPTTEVRTETEPIELTDWGLEFDAGDNSLHFEGKRIPLRSEAVEVVKSLIANGETMSYEDLLGVMSDKDPTMDGKKLMGVLHELNNAFEGYMDPDHWYDKTLRVDGELARFITVNGKIEGALNDFLDPASKSA